MTCAGGVVVFSYADWSAMYPELSASVLQPQAQGYFNQAQLYCDNTPSSPITDTSPGGQRETLLNMMTAHITALNASLNGQPSSPLVGRISNASQGSVSVATQFDVPPGCPQFYAQTKYGVAFWVATAQYRTMQYVPGYAPFNGQRGFGGRRGF